MQPDSRRANTFSEYFQNAVIALKKNAFVLTNFVWSLKSKIPIRTTAAFRMNHVTSKFVINQLKAFKRNKASGADNLPPGLLKDCCHHIAKPLAFHSQLVNKNKHVPTTLEDSKSYPYPQKRVTTGSIKLSTYLGPSSIV